MFGAHGMTERRLAFYSRVISEWVDSTDSAILVVGGGINDRKVLFELGFQNVTISNIDNSVVEHGFAPYSFRRLDAENLACNDKEYDYVIVHAALHHCASPHRALLEMYRVARRAAILIEARDSFIVNLLEAFGISQAYEISAVHSNECHDGGVTNSGVPNFIYRWTEREIEKTIHSFAPFARHCIEFKHGNDSPAVLKELRNGVKKCLLSCAIPAYRVFAYLFPKQQNLFACKIQKPELPAQLHPWLLLNATGEIQLNKEWADKYHQ